MGKITPGEAGGFTYAGKAQEYQAAPSQAHRRSGICVGLLLTARIRRAALLPATLKRVVILPKHRQLFSQFIFVHLTPDIFRNLLLILSHRIIAAVSAVRLDVSNIVAFHLIAARFGARPVVAAQCQAVRSMKAESVHRFLLSDFAARRAFLSI